MTEKIQDQDDRMAPPEATPELPAARSAEAAPQPVPAADAGKSEAEAAPEHGQLQDDIVRALKTVYDPEIPVDIYELGLIYSVDIDADRNVELYMTLTAPGCPVAGDMPGWVENAVSAVPGVGQVKVNLVFDPPWDTSRMSDEARLTLNMF